MQAIERRDPAAPRIPLDLWVRLNHEDYDADFDADGVDLSVGGLALRSDYLPEVGDRLRCRFDDPREPSEIHVDGEVVWAHDAGERCGEFGLRFTQLGEPAEDGLRRLVEHLGGEPGGRVGVRLHLEGVATPIDGDLVEEDERWLTVEQELPFLELGMGVASEQGARGRLASVDLRLEDGVPRLVLGVELDAAAPAPTDTVDEVEHAIAVSDAPATYDDEHLEVANDATMQDVMLPAALAEAALDAPVDEGRREQSVKVFEVGQTADEAPALPADEAPDRMAPLMAKAKAGAAAAWDKTRPALATAWAKVVALAGLVKTHAGPGLRALGSKLATFAGLLWSKVKRGRGKRRTTAAVPKKRVARAPRRRQQAAREEALPPRRKNRRVFALSVLAFVAVGATVYALTAGEDAPPAETPPAATAPPASAAPAAAAPAPAPAPALAPAPAPAPAGAPAPAPAAAPAAAPAPEAAPEPSGGPLAEPSYPTLRDANPSGGGAVSAGQAFGADSVSEGRSATIRLSQPVTTLQGQAMDGGFSVTVPGALALDRAAPIAAANPSVERAMILNRGDHAVLTVRFVSGRTPDYRVVARGRAIEVIIGR